jgi:DNA mismatch endonuclease (patch repair protein)
MTSDRMRRIRQRDTAAELAVRQALRARGLRYRLNWKIPGVRSRPDIAFPGARVAVYVDGCFWHGCLRHGTFAKRNAELWSEKIDQNRLRDKRIVDHLTSCGWQVVRRCEAEDPERIADAVGLALRRTHIGAE